MPTLDRPHPLAGYDAFKRDADARWRGRSADDPHIDLGRPDPGPTTNQLLGELLDEIRGLRADLKAAEWRRGLGFPPAPGSSQ